MPDDELIQIGEILPDTLQVYFPQERLVEMKIPGGVIAVEQLVPVSLLPPAVVQPDFADQAFLTGSARHREPGGTIAGLYPIAIAPVVFCVLNVIVKNEGIDTVDNIEVPFLGM